MFYVFRMSSGTSLGAVVAAAAGVPVRRMRPAVATGLRN